jgi:two-component system, OmpR family, copper resistance phosphate regulon response regulator CusR
MSGTSARPETAPKILVVDDDEAVRESIGMVLRAAGYGVSTAADGQQALECVQESRIDLLLLDLGLPVKSGWEVFEQIVTEYATIPVIIMTGLTNQQFSALAAGASVLMEKPLDVVSLLRCIKELLAEPVEKRANRLRGHGRDFRRVPPAPWATNNDSPGVAA